ncbi:MAG TPA: serine/threonine-protein kinase, partial [Patescibacteria group bacterium]
MSPNKSEIKSGAESELKIGFEPLADSDFDSIFGEIEDHLAKEDFKEAHTQLVDMAEMMAGKIKSKTKEPVSDLEKTEAMGSFRGLLRAISVDALDNIEAISEAETAEELVSVENKIKKPRFSDRLEKLLKSGHLEVEKKLGAGGMGEVYAAEHEYLGPRAVKILQMKDSLGRDISVSPTVLEKLRQEMKILAKLDHPNIVKIFDANINEAGAYIALEKVDGIDLREYIKPVITGTFPVDKALEMFEGIAKAVQYIKEQNFVHRDIKPANILLPEDPETKTIEFQKAKLADFGLSEVKKDIPDLEPKGYKEGTPLYSSPEQFLGKDLDTKSDVYSLGATMYEVLTGKKPIEAKTIPEMTTRVRFEKPK